MMWYLSARPFPGYASQTCQPSLPCAQFPVKIWCHAPRAHRVSSSRLHDDYVGDRQNSFFPPLGEGFFLLLLLRSSLLWLLWSSSPSSSPKKENLTHIRSTPLLLPSTHTKKNRHKNGHDETNTTSETAGCSAFPFDGPRARLHHRVSETVRGTYVCVCVSAGDIRGFFFGRVTDIYIFLERSRGCRR